MGWTKKHLGTILIVLAYVVGIFMVVIPVSSLFGGNWPLVIIGEAESDLSQWWSANSSVVILGVVIFVSLHFIGGWLRRRVKR